MNAYHEPISNYEEYAADARSGFCSSIQGENNDHQEALDYIKSSDEMVKETSV